MSKTPFFDSLVALGFVNTLWSIVDGEYRQVADEIKPYKVRDYKKRKKSKKVKAQR